MSCRKIPGLTTGTDSSRGGGEAAPSELEVALVPTRARKGYEIDSFMSQFRVVILLLRHFPISPMNMRTVIHLNSHRPSLSPDVVKWFNYGVPLRTGVEYRMPIHHYPHSTERTYLPSSFPGRKGPQYPLQRPTGKVRECSARKLGPRTGRRHVTDSRENEFLVGALLGCL